MKKSKNTDNVVLEPENTENNLGTNPKIELISSSDQTFKNPISELQSELDLFDSEFTESSLPIEQEKTEIFVPENVQTREPEKIQTQVPEIQTPEPEKIEEIEPENGKVENQEKVEPEKAKKPKTKKTKKEKEQSEQQEEKTPEIQNLKEPEKKKSKKSKVKSEEAKMKPEIQESKEISQPKVPEVSITGKTNIKKEVVKKEVASDLIDINLLTQAIPDLQIQSSVLALYNENAELKANLLKAKKIIAILKKKLDLAEENEEQWRACAYNLGDIFAEKSHMPLEDVLRRFEAPLDDAEV